MLRTLLEKRGVRLLMKRFKRLVFAALSPFPGLTERIQQTIDRFFVASVRLSAGSGIYVHLDQPALPVQVCVNDAVMSGWAFALSGPLSIDVFLGEARYKTFKPSWYRSDLRQVFPQLTHEHPNAFKHRVALQHLEEGRYNIRLAIQTEDGHEDVLDRPILLLRESTFYNLWQRVNGPDAGNLSEIDLPLHILYAWSGDEGLLEQVVEHLLQQGVRWTLYVSGHPYGKASGKVAKRIADSGNAVYFINRLEEAWPLLTSSPGYFMPFNERAVLRPGALRTWIARIKKQPESDLLYSDHDLLGEDGSYSHSCFTFEWAPDHLMAYNFIGNLWMGRNSLLSSVTPLSGTGDWPYRLLLELGGRAKQIIRIPRMLWSERLSTMPTDRLLLERQAVEAYLLDKGLPADVQQRDGYRYVSWIHPSEPLVSIIIPTTANLELIRPCLESIQLVTNYNNLEIVVLDNSRGRHPQGVAYLASSGVKVVQLDEDFNWSRFNNIGVSHATGSALLFLNDDVLITDPDWLHGLVREAVRPDVGAVGGLLLYPDGSVQHGGVLLVPFGGGAMHLLAHQIPGRGTRQHLDAVVREVSANTGACLMVMRNKFEQMGGFDESLAIVGNDIDLCLKLRKAGYRNLWTPACRLTHCESVSRKTNVPRRDELAMWARWESAFTAGDPFYHPAFELQEGSFDLALHIPDRLLQQFPGQGSPSGAMPTHSVLPTGVNMIAYIRAEMGLGEAARNNARAMERVDIDFGIINFESGNPARMQDFTWVHREVNAPVFSINLIHINPDHLHRVFEELPESFFENRYNIGFWAWELPDIPLDWLNAFRFLDEIWVPSEFVRKAVSKQTSIPVTVMPHCVDVEAAYVCLTRMQLGIPDDVFVFIAMFDPKSIVARKNPDGAINAFMRAFSPTDTHVHLLIKIKEPDTSTLKALEQRLLGWPNIQLVSQACDREQTNALLTLSDCVVSLHRSEGFGLVPAEAMALGKCAILTNWSGNTDYMTPDNCIPIAYSLVELEENYGPYTKGQVWAEPDLDMAAQAMRDISTNPEKAKRMGEAACLHMATYFSPEAIGHRMLSRLQAIAFGVQAS